MVKSDFETLQEMGLEVEIRNGHLLVHSVPYVDARRQVRRGILLTALTGNREVLGRPGDHTIWFVGDLPHKQDGRPMTNLEIGGAHPLWEGFQVNRQFSNKPEALAQTGFADYVSKVLHYVSLLSPEAAALDPAATAFTGKVLAAEPEESIFEYWDTAASRAGIVALSAKLAMPRVAIIGLGGTGGYVLDLLAKTPIRQIHLFDGDVFDQHNAFRAPGVAKLTELATRPQKVDYFADRYSAMHRGIHRHDYPITEENVTDLVGFDFVFLCVDKPKVRKLIGEFLIASQVPYIDTGMDLLLVGDPGELIGSCRVTLCTPVKASHFARRAPLTGGGDADDLYRSNIQLADMNNLNAVLAVYKWKQYCGFYQDLRGAHNLTFSINDQALIGDENAVEEVLAE